MSSPNNLDACNPQRNATVSASAGSGKTWLLITRIVRLLLDGAEPGNIIALTFTRKAAGEMQIRLNQRLFEMATASDAELEEILKMIGAERDQTTKKIASLLYEKLMHNLYPIRIQTFHSFCQDILSHFPLEADIPPGFELTEDTSLLERQAWQQMFDEAGQDKNAPLIDALDIIMQICNGPGNTQTALHNFLTHRSDWWAFTAHTSKAVQFACNELTQTLQLDAQFIHEDAVSDAQKPVKLFLNETTVQNLQIFANLLREVKNKTSDKHANSIDQAVSLYTKGESSIEPIFALIKSAFIKKDGEILLQGRKHTDALTKKLGEDNAGKFIDLHQHIANNIQNVSEQLKRLLILKINSAWYFAGNHYVELFQHLKKEQRLLDFTDLEWKCYQLLQHADNAHWVQYKIDQRIDHLLIDEFQDTNPTQWQLLSPILEEIAANPAQRPRSVFLVGDEKQSIYSFRRANPALQKQATQWLAENLNAITAPLDFSRRSSPAIMHCVNLIFEQQAVKAIMNGYATHDTHLNQLPGQVFLCDLFEDDAENDTENDTKVKNDDIVYFRNPLKQAREINTKTLRHKEAEYIAKQILQLVSQPSLLTDSGQYRAIEYGDILILMRNRTHIDIYEDTLKQFGIPFIGNKKGGLLENLEIQDLCCLLNTLITPYDNLAFAQVLKSPIFNASDEDLMTIAQYRSAPQDDKRHAVTHWYERMLLLAKNSEVPLSKALQRAATLIPRWQQLAEQLPVHDCLDRIFSEANIINRYAAANRAENKQKVAANCQRFLELSLDTDSGRYPSISRFLQRIQHLKVHADNPPEEPLTNNTESRVRLMTIHGSKGLESPVVFLADCNNKTSNKNAYSSLVKWPANKAQPANFQLQLNKDNTDQITQGLQQEKLDEQAREELNLLYVALTRAREQLFISGVRSNRKLENSWYQIIAGGLQELPETESGFSGINGKAFRYLSYDGINVDTAGDSVTDNEKNISIDDKLLTPIDPEQIQPTQKPFYMIAPSLSLGLSEGTALKNTNILNPVTEPQAVTHANNEDSSELNKWRGIVIHRAIELFCNTATYPATEQSINLIKCRLNVEVQRNKAEFMLHLNECIDEAAEVYNQPDFSFIFNPDKKSITYNEMPLMYKKGQQAVYGIVDRVIRSHENIIILDYKSHQLHEAESAQDIAQQFSSQLDYYREGIEKLWPGHKIKSGILFTHPKQVVWI